MPVKKFKIGDTVFRKLDTPQEPGMVTGITERPGLYIYLVTFNGYESSAYDIELTHERTNF